MTTLKECPNCGAPLENVTGNQCPSCGSALPTSFTGADTDISDPSRFNSSAEVMDEVKRLVKSGDTDAAAEVAGKEFGLNPEAAQDTVEQVQFNMQPGLHQSPPPNPE